MILRILKTVGCVDTIVTGLLAAAREPVLAALAMVDDPVRSPV